MARTAAPDILSLDIRLPRIDGIVVLEALRADPETNQLPVVILSNVTEQELMDRGAKLGVLDHLIKAKPRRPSWSAAWSGG
jgi:CheY-like chemotaxis protein